MSKTETGPSELKAKTAPTVPSSLALAKVGRYSLRASVFSDFIRYRYNTMAHETPGGTWKWRVVIEDANGFHEILVKSLIVNVPSFSHEDDIPLVGRKYHMACHGRLRVANGIGIIDRPQFSRVSRLACEVADQSGHLGSPTPRLHAKRELNGSDVTSAAGRRGRHCQLVSEKAERRWLVRP